MYHTILIRTTTQQMSIFHLLHTVSCYDKIQILKDKKICKANTVNNFMQKGKLKYAFMPIPLLHVNSKFLCKFQPQYIKKSFDQSSHIHYKTFYNVFSTSK